MNVSITRYLKAERADKQGRQKIHVRVCWGGHKVRFSVGESVHPDQWYEGTDEDEADNRGRVRKTAGPVAKAINRRLATYTTQLETFFEGRSVVPSVGEVQAEIERIRLESLGHKPAPVLLPALMQPTHPDLTKFSKEFIEHRRAERSKSWRESMTVVANHLQAFRLGIDWPDLTLNTLNQFKVYLQEELDLSDATLHAYVALLRGMLDYSARPELKIPVPPDYRWLETRSVGDTLRPTLVHADLEAIAKVRLARPATRTDDFLESMELTRWYFVLAAATGLRHSDLNQLRYPTLIHFDNVTCLQVVQKKTGRMVPIPISEATHEMLRNPVADKPPASLDSYIAHLKHIGQQAGLTRMVQVGSYYKGELLTDYLPLWQTLCSHMARRTFATLMTQGGLSTRVLQEIMGHKIIASTQKYATVSNSTIVSQSLAAWEHSRVNS